MEADAVKLAGLLEKATWKFAWRYRKFLPHHYTLAASWNADDFAWAVATVARLGTERPFGKNRSFVYFDWDGDDGIPWCAWCMDGEAERELINKARRR